MVRAILEGIKTQTRRVVKPQPFCETHGVFHVGGSKWEASEQDSMGRRISSNRSDEWHCPYGAVGDRLWVRETHMPMPHLNAKVFYRATDRLVGGRWKPSIFMPRILSRALLEIVSIRVERLQEISEEDAYAEGCEGETCAPVGSTPGDGSTCWTLFKPAYQKLWDSINGKKHPWSSNPFVWVIEFKRVQDSTPLPS